MSLTRLVFRNLLYHWRGNLAVLLGVAVGTTVLIGALLVGDSLRGSLKELTDHRLGWVDQALITNRFFRAELANSDLLPCKRVAGAILLRGTVTAASSPIGEGTPPRRAGKVTIYGIENRFNFARGAAPQRIDLAHPEPIPANTDKPGVFLNEVLAHDLNVDTGASITIHLPRNSLVPRESLLGRKDADDVIQKVAVKVTGILTDKSIGDRFTLNPTPEPPRNLFLPLWMVQKLVDQPGKINALFVGDASAELQNTLDKLLNLDDWGLVVLDPESRKNPKFTQPPYLSLESRQLLLDSAIESAALKAAKKANLRAAPTLVYLANRIASGGKFIPYSIVAALDASLPAPLGPFLTDNGKPLGDDEILLADWDQSPLHAKPGDKITVAYFAPEDSSTPKELTHTFTLRGFVPLKGLGADPYLTPEFPGITDKLNIREWNPPFPFNRSLIRPGDENEAFWNKYRTTPKAYISLETGKKLWSSRFGELTSIRLAPQGTENLAKAAADFKRCLLEELMPEKGGFVFQDIREEGLKASAGGTDFGMLFLGFSFFLIIAALLLIGLLFRLNIDRRASEIGLLLATGYRRSTVRLLLLVEGIVLILLGGLLGMAAGRLYAWLLVSAFQVLWPESSGLSFLRLHVNQASLAKGYLAAAVMSVLTILWAVHVLGRVAPTALLQGETNTPELPTLQRRPTWSLGIAVVSFLLAGALTAGGVFINGHEAKAVTFFGSGFFLLVAGLAFLWAKMTGTPATVETARSQKSGVQFNLAILSVRNASRNPLRSMLTAGLLASAAFLIVSVESFKRQAGKEFLDKNSGSGGFALLAESDVPIYQDLNGDKARGAMTDELERIKQDQAKTDPDTAEAHFQAQQELLSKVEFFSFRVHGGDDASCLNLYQPRKPQLLGVPHSLVDRGGFQFGETKADSPETKANPWLLLEKDQGDGAIPVVGEGNTVVWMLHANLGDLIDATDERGASVKLRVVGLLKDSVFQNGLLLSEANFLKLFPSQEGQSFFLIDTKDAPAEEVRPMIETVLADQGFTVTPTAQRLDAFLAVENMYLTTFQALGGLGLLLGAAGLAIVLLRGIWERRAELALLRALGYRPLSLGRLLFFENGFLLLYGLGTGATAALLAVLPSLLSGAATVHLGRLMALLAAVVIVGAVFATGALIASLRTPLLSALRRE